MYKNNIYMYTEVKLVPKRIHIFIYEINNKMKNTIIITINVYSNSCMYYENNPVVLRRKRDDINKSSTKTWR